MASYIDASYPVSNTELILDLDLRKHPEGGYFKETDRQSAEISSPFAEGKQRSLATSIYYLLTYEERQGKLHMNKSVTYHVLHQGRAEYTLIKPLPSGGPPTIEKHVMGTNKAAGETRLLIVEGGVWKMSEIPQKDLVAAEGDSKAMDRTGCLITEVVTPGFDWEDHVFLTREGLEALFEGDPDKKRRIEEYGSRASILGLGYAI